MKNTFPPPFLRYYNQCSCHVGSKMSQTWILNYVPLSIIIAPPSPCFCCLLRCWWFHLRSLVLWQTATLPRCTSHPKITLLDAQFLSDQYRVRLSQVGVCFRGCYSIFLSSSLHLIFHLPIFPIFESPGGSSLKPLSKSISLSIYITLSDFYNIY